MQSGSRRYVAPGCLRMEKPNPRGACRGGSREEVCWEENTKKSFSHTAVRGAGVFGESKAGRAHTTHRWGLFWRRAVGQGLPEDNLGPRGRGTEMSQPPGSACQWRAVREGQGKDRHSHKEKKKVYLGLCPLLPPCPTCPGFARAQLFKESDLASP